LSGNPAKGNDLVLRLDPGDAGAVFEGIGAVSAGASSRLLIDYPEPIRSQILDYLFKPDYGAAFQHLKVEIGGDINSTDGTEPSHARTREEFLHPKREYFERGYEWWLAQEARKRNPRIIFDCLPWGAPGWIGYGRFFSQDGADYIASYLLGMKRFHGLEFDYVGILNEQEFDADYIKLLRRTLDERGLQRVRIVAADLNGPPQRMWSITEAAAKDPELAAAIEVFGVHYAHGQTPKSALEFQAAGKRLWSSEDGEWTWETMRPIRGRRAQKINRNFIENRLTKTEFWSLVTAYHDSFTAPQSGVITANTPWSGAFDLQPELWAVAHTTQFAQPGWHYLEDACRRLPKGGSVVALASPDGKDVSVVIETYGAKGPQHLALRPADSFKFNRLHQWRSNASAQFVQDQHLMAADGVFVVRVDPNAIYSLTTTTGQRKGHATNPPARPFPSPYREEFDSYRVGATPRYLSDCGGAFEVVAREDGGQCLRQQIHQPGIDWAAMRYASTVLGDPAWGDVAISVEAALETQPGPAADANALPYLAVVARFHPGATFDHFKAPHPPGYTLRLYADGRWALLTGSSSLVAGRVADPATGWHKLALHCTGAHIVGVIDDQTVADVTDRTYTRGLAGVGCGLHPARFDNLVVSGAIVAADPRIDRYALVTRHNIEWNDLRGQIPLGNGEFCFNADGTGLQTFGGSTLSHWAWHSAPLPPGCTAADVPATGTVEKGRITGPMHTAAGRRELDGWMFRNPHPINLGRVRLMRPEGGELKAEDVQRIVRRYDLWSGLHTSHFEVDGQPISIETCVHPNLDLVAVCAESPLLRDGQLVVMLDFPYPNVDSRSPWVGDWNLPDAHTSEFSLRQNERRADIQRKADVATYHAGVAWSEGCSFAPCPVSLSSDKRHSFVLSADMSGRLEFICSFAAERLNTVPTVAQTQQAAAAHWRDFWTTGGAIDLSQSKDPRWRELERRIVLSQYQMAAQSAGSWPSAEIGLMGIDFWSGQFHMEMIWWHLAHYGLWDRWPMAERALDCYRQFLPVARQLAGQFDYKGAKWGKQVGPEGRTAPWDGSFVLHWQQPHPIFLAELEYRLRPTRATLEKWQEIVFATADYMADFRLIRFLRTSLCDGGPAPRPPAFFALGQ
jgi:galactosylceramidase